MNHSSRPSNSQSRTEHYRIGVMAMDVEGRDSNAFSKLVREATRGFSEALVQEQRLDTEVFAFSGPHLTPGAGSYSPLDFLQIGLAEKTERSLPFLLIITEVDLTSTKLAYTLALPSQLMNVAILSSKRLDPDFWGKAPDFAITARRLTVLLLHSFGHLLNLSHPADNNADQRVVHDCDSINVMRQVEKVEDLDAMEGFSEAQWRQMKRALPREANERSTRDGRLVFIIKTLLRDAGAIGRGVMRANPFRLLMKLPTMIAAALSVIIVLLFSAETWDMAGTVTLSQVALFAGVSLAAALFVLYRAFALSTQMSRDRLLTETTVITIAVTMLSLALTLLVLFAGLGAVMYLGIVSIFPEKLMASWPTADPAVKILDHVKLSLFLAAMGVLAGSLGGRSDSSDLVRGVLFIDEES